MLIYVFSPTLLLKYIVPYGVFYQTINWMYCYTFPDWYNYSMNIAHTIEDYGCSS